MPTSTAPLIRMHPRAGDQLPVEVLLAAVADAVALGYQQLAVDGEPTTIASSDPSPRPVPATGPAPQLAPVSVDRLLVRRGEFVPVRPARDLVAVAPVLVVEADGSVVPLSPAVDRSLSLGSLADARLTTLAEEWLERGRGEELADACAQTWSELLAEAADSAQLNWYDEVAARTRGAQTSECA